MRSRCQGHNSRSGPGRNRSALPADQLPATIRIGPDLRVTHFKKLFSAVMVRRSTCDDRRARIRPDFEVIGGDPVDGELPGLQYVEPPLLVNNTTIGVR